jgi:hypothetical protein
MNRTFMRKHVKQMPHVSGVEFDLKDRVDLMINGKHSLYRVEDAIKIIPCILKWRVNNPHAKCGGSAVKPRHGQKIRLATRAWQMLQDRLKEVECPGIYPGRDCCNDNPEVLPDE